MRASVQSSCCPVLTRLLPELHALSHVHGVAGHERFLCMQRTKADLWPSSSLPPPGVLPVKHTQDAAGDGSGVPTPENTSGGRVSSLKQDNADNRTLQRRARNRDAARRTRLKKMLLLQACSRTPKFCLVDKAQCTLCPAVRCHSLFSLSLKYHCCFSMKYHR